MKKSSYLAFPILLYGVVAITLYFFMSKENLIVLNSDDAFYYYELAKNYVNVGWVTYDEINKTNGFHPLWFLFLVPIFKLLGGGVEPVRVVSILSVIFVLAGVYVHLYSIRKRYSTDCLLFSTVGLLFFSTFVIKSKMEVVLAVLILFVVTSISLRFNTLKVREKVNKYDLIVSLMLGLSQVSRLDAVFFTFIYLFVVTLYNRRKLLSADYFKKIAVLCVGPLITGLGYLFSNIFYFGHITPVSSYVKSIDGIGFNERMAYDIFTAFTPSSYVDIYVAVSVSTLIIGLAYTLWRSIKGESNTYYFIIILVVLFQLSTIVYYLTNYYWPPMIWYYYNGIFVFAFVFPEIYSTLSEYIGYSIRHNLPWINRSVLAISLLISVAVPFASVFANDESDFRLQTYDLVRYINANYPEGVVLGMGDSAGVFGYFSKHRVVQLEGLTNDYQFAKVLEEENVLEYLETEGIDYLVFGDAPVFRNETRKLSLGRHGVSVLVYPDCIEYVNRKGGNRNGTVVSVNCLLKKNFINESDGIE